jgi:hypothetical protein
VILTALATVLAVVLWMVLFWEYLVARRDRRADTEQDA